MKIITAIGNPAINEELKKNEKFNVISKDIFYKEGILEFLEQNKNIDIIIINEELDGKIDLKDLIIRINKINIKIKIIIIYRNKNKYLKEDINGINLFKLCETDINFNKLNEVIYETENIKNNIKKEISGAKDKKILKNKNKFKNFLEEVKKNKKNSKIDIKVKINIEIK